MHATRRAVPREPKDRYPDEGVQAWVVLVFLAAAAVACFLLLRFTINMMTDLPPVEKPPVTARPAP